MSESIQFESTLWRYSGANAWYFITLPQEVAQAVTRAVSGLPRKGFGSVRVSASIGIQNWTTSIFPDRESQSYVLPVKASVRKRAEVGDGDSVLVRLDLLL